MDYKEKNEIRTYPVSHPEELTSDQIQEISELIKERLDLAVSDGFTDRAGVVVKFVYTGSTPSYEFNTTKSMKKFNIKD